MTIFNLVSAQIAPSALKSESDGVEYLHMLIANLAIPVKIHVQYQYFHEHASNESKGAETHTGAKTEPLCRVEGSWESVIAIYNALASNSMNKEQTEAYDTAASNFIVSTIDKSTSTSDLLPETTTPVRRSLRSTANFVSKQKAQPVKNRRNKVKGSMTKRRGRKPKKAKEKEAPVEQKNDSEKSVNRDDADNVDTVDVPASEISDASANQPQTPTKDPKDGYVEVEVSMEGISDNGTDVANDSNDDDPDFDVSQDDSDDDPFSSVNEDKKQSSKQKLICDVCHKTYADIDNLKKHRCKGFKSPDRVKCKICKKSYANNYCLSVHKKLKHSSQESVVDKPAKPAKASDKTQQMLIQLVRNQRDEDGMFQCYQCNFKSEKGRNLREHILRKHMESKTYSCQHCKRTYAVRRDWKTHEERCGQSHVCETCGKVYKARSTLLIHKKSHEDGFVPYAFKCDQCDRAFSNATLLANHKKVRHEGLAWICEECGRSFTQKHSLQEHQTVFHKGGRQRFTCNECGKSFSYNSSLENHMKAHRNQKMYGCEQCSARFNTSNALYIHKSVHDVVRKHACEDCGRRFTQKGALIRHSRIHTGEKPFACNQCGKKFSDQSILRRHMTIHQKDLYTRMNSGIGGTSELSVFAAMAAMQPHMSAENSDAHMQQSGPQGHMDGQGQVHIDLQDPSVAQHWHSLKSEESIAATGQLVTSVEHVMTSQPHVITSQDDSRSIEHLVTSGELVAPQQSHVITSHQGQPQSVIQNYEHVREGHPHILSTVNPESISFFHTLQNLHQL